MDQTSYSSVGYRRDTTASVHGTSEVLLFLILTLDLAENENFKNIMNVC